MYINPERSQVVDFIPYLRVGDQLLVAKGNPLHLTGLADLCGHRLAAAVGTVYEKAGASSLPPIARRSGKPRADDHQPDLDRGQRAGAEGRTRRCARRVDADRRGDDQGVARRVRDRRATRSTTTRCSASASARTSRRSRTAVDTAFKAIVADGAYADADQEIRAARRAARCSNRKSRGDREPPMSIFSLAYDAGLSVQPQFSRTPR